MPNFKGLEDEAIGMHHHQINVGQIREHLGEQVIVLWISKFDEGLTLERLRDRVRFW